MNWDFVYRGETQDLDDATRRTAATGTFIRLSDGYTHYELGGSPAGRCVVLIHGFSVPYFIWDPTFQALTSFGFYVLRYDLFGRGLSDRPRVDYNVSLFVRQLRDLLEALNLSYVNLAGLSMGGAIASAFTVDSPEHVCRVILIDPIGVHPVLLNPIYRLALLPGISELILMLAGGERALSDLAAGVFDRRHVEHFRDQYRAQMQIKGFRRALLSTLRNKMLNGFPDVYQRLGSLQKPTLLLWGKADRAVPVQESRWLLKVLSHVEFQAVEDCGHIPHYEKPDVVNPILTRFLGSQ
jgi:pimeloyl-ACP methyl ester carboxylesterase